MILIGQSILSHFGSKRYNRSLLRLAALASYTVYVMVIHENAVGQVFGLVVDEAIFRAAFLSSGLTCLMKSMGTNQMPVGHTFYLLVKSSGSGPSVPGQRAAARGSRSAAASLPDRYVVVATAEWEGVHKVTEAELGDRVWQARHHLNPYQVATMGGSSRILSWSMWAFHNCPLVRNVVLDGSAKTMSHRGVTHGNVLDDCREPAVDNEPG